MTNIDHQFDARTTGLVIFDMLEIYRAPIEAAGTLPNVLMLLEHWRQHDAPVFFARADHRKDGADLAATISDVDINHKPFGPDNPIRTKPKVGSGEPGLAVLAELAPRDSEYDIPKHRWSAFFGTHLELSLRRRGVDTIVLVGGSTHVGIAATMYAARDMDFQVLVASDGCHGREPQRSFFMEEIFPRACRVRTTAEVIAAVT
ncbi:MAG: isochorismatase family protein [Mycobacterium sp.]